MNCASCGHTVPDRAKFCPECGGAQAPQCASCGAELRPAVKFCSECGTRVAASAPGRSRPGPASQTEQVAAPPAPAGTRKIVTIVFADLAGSTALQERLDPESTQRFMERYYDAMRAAGRAPCRASPGCDGSRTRRRS